MKKDKVIELKRPESFVEDPKLPKNLQVKAKQLLHNIWMAPGWRSLIWNWTQTGMKVPGT